MPLVTAIARTGLVMASVWLAASGATDRDLYAQGPSGNGFRLVRVRVFDGVRTLQGAEVAVEGGTIRSVGAASAEWQHLPAIDATGMTLLPGLIESHAHVTEAGIYARRCGSASRQCWTWARSGCPRPPSSLCATQHEPT